MTTTETIIAHTDEHESIQCPHCDRPLCVMFPGPWDSEELCEQAILEGEHVSECPAQGDPLMEALDAPETYAGPTSISPRTAVAPAKQSEDAR